MNKNKPIKKIRRKRTFASFLVKLSAGEEGWTFIETLIVIAIILLLSGTVAVVAIKQVGKAKIVRARSNIDSFMSGLQIYYGDCLTFPTEEQGLEAMFEKPSIDPVPEDWDGPYINKRIEKDPWKNDYVYTVPGPNGLDYAILSYGADGLQGGSGNDEDIVSW